MNRIILSLLFLLLGLTGMQAQQRKFSVASFAHDPFDLTAKNDQHKKIDGNGSLYAIIKVTSTSPDDQLSDYRFNFGNMNHEVVVRDGELWVYVQRNAKMVTISRQGFATINKYDLRTTVEAGNTYTMQLSPEAEKVYTQMVQFAVEPANTKAVVMVKSLKDGANEELFGSTDDTGGVAKSLEYGTYTYRVMAENYHPTEGRFTLNDRTQIHKEAVALRPNFSLITLQVQGGATIFVNGEERGHGQWTGPLKPGNYHVECRKTSHRPSEQTITVEENNNRTITLTPPTPITGTLAITSRPLGAKVKVDGKDCGVTPQNLNDILIGRHTIELTHQKYRSERQEAEVKEDETTNVEIELKASAAMDVANREKKSAASTAERPFLSRNGMYIQGSYQLGSLQGYGINVGGYVTHVNMEIFYLMGASDVTVYGFSSSGSKLGAYDLSVAALGIKMGYGIPAGSRFRFTPQVGVTQISGSDQNLTFSALAGTVGLRAEFACTRHFGVSCTPEYSFAVSEKDVFKQLADASSKIKGWATGFSARLGVYYCF